MSELIKIREMSIKYDISARALKYYEDMGLIASTRSEDYAYRMYDEAAVKRLEQILILRKLNISIKDIQRIFDAPDSKVVLEVLGKKVNGIDEEVSLLHELKSIVLEFIEQIKKADFAQDADVKLLYEKAQEIEGQLVNVDYNGNPANVNRLLEITEKLDKKIPDVMIVRMPKFLALTSQYQNFGELFNEDCLMFWIGRHKNLEKSVIFDCSDFLCRRNDGKFRWLYSVHECVKEIDTAPYEVMEFEGGLYASAVCIDGDDDSLMKVENKIMKWLEGTNFILDRERDIMGNMTYNDDEIKKGLGYEQLQRYVPIKLKEEKIGLETSFSIKR
ncbi:DNA-binding transcriptional MerR regulator [Mobilisporobacter senegalensis]|uniref:DNA-binding transcriptional MerR regulator n=1 Tax=Mobilisporobacter senegalensis TaxID=1329262 RepID=A0A3N1XPA0_9FIRM|nr:MerR family transcriptional regulator [Mobilisporobacter senegalensis]ROR28493.1 DNA-binding transcriptional MerR regulator [Mobilisporobacter senegalensis]